MDETDEQIARRYFGPILLQKTCLIGGPHNAQACRIWGEFETTYRLVAIIVAEFILAATLILRREKKSSDRQPTGGGSGLPPPHRWRWGTKNAH